MQRSPSRDAKKRLQCLPRAMVKSAAQSVRCVAAAATSRKVRAKTRIA